MIYELFKTFFKLVKIKISQMYEYLKGLKVTEII